MRHYLLAFATLATGLCSSCASIVSHSRWPVAFNSSPMGATVTVVNRVGQQVYSGVTPASTSLKSGSSFFNREHYDVTFSMPGYDSQKLPLTTSVNGWYFGNIVFGGLIGLLIVDPATGAMYRLDQQVVQTGLSQTKAEAPQVAPLPNGPQVVLLDQVPAELRDKLVLLPAPATGK